MKLLLLLVAGLTSSATAQFDAAALDEAILTDLLESYTEYQVSTCTGAAGSTTYTFNYPGVNADSEWYAPFEPFEEDLFLAAMTHTDANNRSWTIRIGQGGNMYSHFCPLMHGETMAPQSHTSAPWIDEVHQTVSVNGYLNLAASPTCNGAACPANFNHGAGTYQKDAPYTDVPFYSQSLAKHCKGASCTFAAWTQQAHLPTIFTSPIISFNRYTNCGNGIIEHTEMIHNFAPEGSDPNKVDQTYFNLPWSGVRRSSLPFALEPNPSTGTLSYQDPDTVDYCPLCNWGNDAPGGPQGRCAREDLKNLGGYTTFVAPGLFVNRETGLQQYLWCRKPNNPDGSSSCSTSASTCMAQPSECYNGDGSVKEGYTPVKLEVAADSFPDCRDHVGIYEGYQTLKCKLHSVGFGSCGTYLYAGTSSDECAPWLSGGTMGLFREDNNQGINIPYIRHWSWGTADNWMYFSVYSQNLTEAVSLVNNMFDNRGNPNALPLLFKAFPPGATLPGQNYNPAALDSVTFVYGDGQEYGVTVPGAGRRRIGSSNRDYTVFTTNWWQYGAKLTPGDTFSKRGFIFASDLGSAKSTADNLIPKVVPAKIEDTRWNPRAINIYKSGTSFDVVAATSAQGTSTTCTSTSATFECSGFSTPKPGHSPFFYVTCGTSTYLGPDPYHFTPGNGVSFTLGSGLSNDNTQFVRSYACDGQIGVRPTWKLIGFFDASTCVSLGSGVTYDDRICVMPTPTASPTAPPTNVPSSPPTAAPSSRFPTNVPTSSTSTPSIPSPSTFVSKYVCASSRPLESTICADGSLAGGKCNIVGKESSCGNKQFPGTCYWSSTCIEGSPTAPTTPPPAPTSCIATGYSCSSGSDCCSGSCPTKGKNSNKCA